MNNKEYLNYLEENVFSLIEPKELNVVRGYFYGHLPRFEDQFDMFRDHLDSQDIDIVEDFGTGYP